MPEEQLPQTLDVTGKVILERRSSYAGAKVCIESTCASTPDDGSYTLENVPPTGTVQISHPSYLLSTRDYEGEAGETVTLSDVTLLGGDPSQNGQIGPEDAAIIGMAWNSTPSDGHWDSRADITDDGIVNILDMVAVLSNLGQSTAKTSRRAMIIVSPTSPLTPQ